MSCNAVPKNARSGHIFDVVRREMDDFVTRLSGPESWAESSPIFAPRTNVLEAEDQYQISMDLPGMTSDDFSLEVHEGRLTVSGERACCEAAEGTKYHRVERHHGKFSRTFALGQDLDVEGVSAEYNNGVLTVTVPKAEKDLPRKIEVKVR